MRKSVLFILAGLWLAALTGCGQEEVLYGEGTGSEGQEVQEEVLENQASRTLRNLLEMGDEKEWEETIEGVGGTINVKAEIRVPDAANLYTMTATKYYLTKEDKKRIAEYFMDADTIKVNKDDMRTKESIREEIGEIEDWLQEPLDEEGIAYYKQEIEELNQEMVSTPNYDDIKEEPGDYSGNYYIGNKNNARYSIRFIEDPFTDDPANICSWISYREEEDQTENTDTNNDKMTEEKAEAQAEKLCEDLGISGMEVVSVESEESLDDSGNGTGHMEYYVDLVRYINGVPVDSNIYEVSKPYSESEANVTPYTQENVWITFDDFGLVGMSYYGSIKVGEVGDAVKLLSYSQIQEVLRRELETMKTEEGAKKNTWTLLELSYLRIADESKPDEFCYVPVWRLGKKYADMMYSTEYNIFLNAIDGSRIYPEEVGAATNFLP